MKKYRISLETMSDVQDFVKIAEMYPRDSLRIKDEAGHEVSAQSILGVLYSLEWSNMYLYSKDDSENVYDNFSFFII